MAMQARTLTRTLLVCAGLAVASSAMAQATDKDRSTSTTSKQSTTKSSAAKPAATKRLDFSPSSNIKETATRPAAPGANAQTPAKEGWHCDHSGASDA
jgi:hypothetical protein